MQKQELYKQELGKLKDQSKELHQGLSRIRPSLKDYPTGIVNNYLDISTSIIDIS